MTQNKTRCEGPSHLVLVVGMGESRAQQRAFSGGLVAASSRRRLSALPSGLLHHGFCVKLPQAGVEQKEANGKSLPLPVALCSIQKSSMQGEKRTSFTWSGRLASKHDGRSFCLAVSRWGRTVPGKGMRAVYARMVRQRRRGSHFHGPPK